MKILAVRFQNLNSLKGEHAIRFDKGPLADAGLFAITGPTGAGKTTILDAITVGLYGRVHRHDSDKPLELMTRHTTESTSEVEFEANGKHYHSKWQIRRSRGKLEGKIQAVHMEICDLEDDKPFDLKPSQVPDKVAELCGLDYNQFLRSVMLSQGDFARFLKASANDRSLLLEKITDTGIYSDISRFAFEKAKQERIKKEELERSLQVTQLLTDEQLAAYATTITGHKAQENLLEQETATLQEKRQWLLQVEQLRTRADAYQTNLQVQEEKLASLKPDFEKLQHHEQANQFVGELTQINLADGHLSEVQAQLVTLQKQLPVLEAELEHAGKTVIESSKAHQQQEKAISELEPVLEQVQQLDHQLKTIRERFTTDKETYRQAAGLLEQEKTTFQQKEGELTALTQKANSLKNWLKENVNLKEIRENLHEFRQAVKDISDAERAILALQQEQKTIAGQLQHGKTESGSIQASLKEQQEKQALLEQQKQEKYTQLQALLASKSIDELEQQVQEQLLLPARYERLLELSKNYTAQQQKAAAFAQQLYTLNTDLTTKTEEFNTLKEAHQTAARHLDDLVKLVSLQQRIQEFEQARQQLQPEQPCPLCGSEHHPFVDGHYISTLSEDEQRCNAQQALVKKLEADMNTLQLQLNTLQHQQESTLKLKTETDAETERLQSLYTLQGKDISISIAETNQLQEQLYQQQAVAGQLQQQLSQARALSREIESINSMLQQLREEHLQAQGKISKLQQAQELQQTQYQRIAAQLQDLQEQLLAYTQMAQSFAAYYGFTFTAENRQELLQKLEKQTTEYQQHAQNYEALRDPFTELQQQVKSLKEKLDEKNLAQEQMKAHLEQVHTQLTTLKEERTKLFGDKDVQQERQAAQRELSNRAKQAEDARATLQRKQQELQEQQQRQQEYSTRHLHKKSELDALRDGLLLVLQQKGIATIETLSQMLLHRDEADRLANLKAQTEKQLTELRKSLSDVKQELAQLEQKQLTTETADTLQQQLAARTEEHRNLIAARARLEQLLEQDKEQRVKNQALMEQLQVQQKEYSRWAQLSDLIGSEKGHKFSKFAQGLTLAKLVQLANRHLQKLNDRYRILKSEDDELELFIVDTYQADTTRPMNSLSGGESFLVSLALALGLSDLAGRKTQINSLFIDEGFGTLDADTLDAAISTLENLQASGKMIGIISHVEALKERIATQIKIVKKAGGVSTIELKGF